MVGAQTPRGQWKMAKIQELVKSADGSVRVAIVKTATASSLRRPTALLYLLEVQANGEPCYTANPAGTDSEKRKNGGNRLSAE